MPTGLTVEYAKPFADDTPAAGRRFLLHPRFTDYNTDGVFVAIGHIPNSDLFKGQLDIDDLLSQADDHSQEIDETRMSVETSSGSAQGSSRIPPS